MEFDNKIMDILVLIISVIRKQAWLLKNLPNFSISKNSHLFPPNVTHTGVWSYCHVLCSRICIKSMSHEDSLQNIRPFVEFATGSCFLHIFLIISLDLSC